VTYEAGRVCKIQRSLDGAGRKNRQIDRLAFPMNGANDRVAGGRTVGIN
jgi:hypothetical protein